MSPIVARAAARSMAQAAGRRQFSIMRMMRDSARSFEPHPFQRLPQGKPQAGDYGRLFKRAGGNLVIYLPLIFGLLGWPYAGKLILDGHIN